MGGSPPKTVTLPPYSPGPKREQHHLCNHVVRGQHYGRLLATLQAQATALMRPRWRLLPPKSFRLASVTQPASVSSSSFAERRRACCTLPVHCQASTHCRRCRGAHLHCPHGRRASTASRRWCNSSIRRGEEVGAPVLAIAGPVRILCTSEQSR